MKETNKQSDKMIQKACNKTRTYNKFYGYVMPPPSSGSTLKMSAACTGNIAHNYAVWQSKRIIDIVTCWSDYRRCLDW
jgi:hypothetical protein